MVVEYCFTRVTFTVHMQPTLIYFHNLIQLLLYRLLPYCIMYLWLKLKLWILFPVQQENVCTNTQHTHACCMCLHSRKTEFTLWIIYFQSSYTWRHIHKHWEI